MRKHYSRPRWFVGVTPYGRVAFRSSLTPTFLSHGAEFNACIGPFETKRGAKWAEQHSSGNPHAQTVAEMERLAKSET